MNNIIVAIERSKFNYLFKYDTCASSLKNVINYSYELLSKLITNDEGIAASIIEQSLPLFEDEAEVVLLELDTSQISYQMEFSLSAVLKIIPLNQLAKDLLQVKLNTNLKLAVPLPESTFSKIKTLRELNLRNKSAADLLSIFQLELPTERFIIGSNEAIERKLLGKDKTETTLGAILNLESTPNGIPSGHVEGLMKIIGTGQIKVMGHMDKLRKSPLYQLLFDNYETINKKSFQAAYDYVDEVISPYRDQADKLREIITSKEVEGDIFKLCYYYFNCKRILLSNNGNIQELIKIVNGESISLTEFAQALYLIGSVQSYEILHESIQKLKHVPVFGKKKPIDPLITYFGVQNKELPSTEKIIEAENKAAADLSTSETHSIDATSKEDEKLKPDKDKVDKNIAVQTISPSKDETNDEQIKDIKAAVDSNNDLKLFEATEGNTNRLNLIGLAKKEISGKSAKEVMAVLIQVYSTNKEFKYSELEKSLLKEQILLKKDGKLIKKASDLLNIFEPLK